MRGIKEMLREKADKDVPQTEAPAPLTPLLQKLAKEINNLGHKDLLEEWSFKYLKVEDSETESISINEPCFKKWQLSYACFHYLEKTASDFIIKAYDSDYRNFQAPSYAEIEIKRGKYEPLPSDAYLYFRKNDIGFILHLYLEGRANNFKLFFNKAHRDQALTLIKEIRKFMSEHNYYKGEKLQITDGYDISFLEYPKLLFEDLVIENKILEEIKLNLIALIENPGICKKYKIPWRRGILLSGEPGTGKTKLGKILCNTLKCTVLWITPVSVDGAWEMKQIFEAARYLSPTLIIFEDVDFLGADREISRNPILGELLNQLDGNAPNNGVFVLASSNRPGLLDKALAFRPGRFDLKLELELPNENLRKKLIDLFSQGKEFEVPLETWGKEIVAVTTGMTGAQIQEMFTYAAIRSCFNGDSKIKKESLLSAVEKIRYKIPNELSR